MGTIKTRTSTISSALSSTSVKRARRLRTGLVFGMVLLLLQSACLGGRGPSGPKGQPPEPTTDGGDGGFGRDGSLGEDAANRYRADAATPTALPYDGAPSLCSRDGDDAIRDLFCSATRPAIGSLSDLQTLLEIGPNPQAPLRTAEGYLSAANAVVLGHSTALSGNLISPINPRIVLLSGNIAMAFQRGIQRVELATTHRQSGRVTLYLITFEQACNESPHGCTPGDLYTPALERNWRLVELNDDEGLKNTAADCRQCHQRGLREPMLLMRELEGPWTHFFEAPLEPGARGAFPGTTGGDLLTDYLQAKGDEPLAGVPAETFTATIGFFLQIAVPQAQPLLFDSKTILGERWLREDGTWASAAGRSPSWDASYAAFKRGERQALPYFAPRPTDPGKQAALTAAYKKYRAGDLEQDSLPDLADIFPDDAQTRAEIGLAAEPEAYGADLLIQACGSCHNDVLDQSISRSRFNINLGALSRQGRAQAIRRLQLAPDAPAAMPPAEARTVDDRQRQKLIDYLRADTRTSADDAKLARAAKLGMAGPSQKL